MPNDLAGDVCLRMAGERLEFPDRDYGLELAFDDIAGLPSPSPLAAHRADVKVTYNGVSREFTWAEFFRKLGIRAQ